MNLFHCEYEPGTGNRCYSWGQDPAFSPFQKRWAGGYLCHIIHDEGSVFGRAETNRFLLLYIGCITNINLNDNRKASDSPHAAAAYLLNQFQGSNFQFLDQLSGDYSIALINKTNGRVLLTTDPSGSRPVFYTSGPESTAFSTQLYTMRSCGVDRSYEPFLLGFEFLPFGRTLYKGVHRLENGQCIEIQNGQAREVYRIPQSAISFKPMPTTERRTIDQLYNIFMEIIEEQMQTGREAAVVTGGFDSALIASCLKRLGCSVTTYTFRFKNKKYNQPLMDTLTRYVGSHHCWVDIDKTVIANGLERFSQIFNNVATQPHYLIQTAHLTDCMRKNGHTHAFTGDGCDGIFHGYPTVHLRARITSMISKTEPRLLKALFKILCCPLLERLSGHPLRIIRNVIKVSTRPHPMRYYVTARTFDKASLNQLYTDAPPLLDVEALLKTLAMDKKDCSDIELAYLGKSLVGLNKNKLDSCSKYSGVALVSPYTHRRLKQFVSSLPEQMMRPVNRNQLLSQGKYILTRMAEEKKLLPNDIIHQAKKSPVNAPIDLWYIKELMPLLLHGCNELPFSFRSDYLKALLPNRFSETLYRKFKPVDAYTSQAICLLYTYARFCR